jgi:cytochrome b6-f complex subunit 5
MGILTVQNLSLLSLLPSIDRGRGIKEMVEALLSGIVPGLIPITLAGSFVTAYLQYRRGDQLDL